MSEFYQLIYLPTCCRRHVQLKTWAESESPTQSTRTGSPWGLGFGAAGSEATGMRGDPQLQGCGQAVEFNQTPSALSKEASRQKAVVVVQPGEEGRAHAGCLWQGRLRRHPLRKRGAVQPGGCRCTGLSSASAEASMRLVGGSEDNHRLLVTATSCSTWHREVDCSAAQVWMLCVPCAVQYR
jgi:hypothetical protein